ncbi:hypothetical protein IV203_033813 [Nitzschia inconspicua]|uniref:Acyltransferase 3 domain-containing protein n=1 Tax=Nitzschia inconspicua TaxID=303405 RepID=A0A9K3M3H4_9STRA|nr:hypothetical protein IV203_033813 [Nitzschia inconspicua]
MASVTKKGRQQPPLRHMHVRMVDLDNCKGVFMFYVVVYHFFNNWILDQAIQDWPSEFWRNFFISYTYWHEKMAVPGFSFISGLLGKGFDNYYDGSDSKKENDKRKQRWQASISTLLVGPFLMQLFNIGMKIIVLSLFPVEKEEDERDENQDNAGDATEGASTSDNPILPNVIFDYDFLETWYLLALLGWRILTPVFLRLLRFTDGQVSARPCTTTLILGKHRNGLYTAVCLYHPEQAIFFFHSLF